MTRASRKGDPRQEFPKSVRLAAQARAGGRCEAVGEDYDLPAGERCNADLAFGYQFHHYPRPARDPHPDTRTLGNCLVTCRYCNAAFNRNVDTPRENKIKRIRKNVGRRALDLDRPPPREPKMRGRSTFPKGRKMQSRQFPTRQK